MIARMIGADEAGRGPFAGPIAVTAVLGPREWRLEGLRDSKRITTEKKRRAFYEKIIADPALTIARGWRGVKEIDAVGIHRAGINGFTEAICTLLRQAPDAEVIVDGNMRFQGFIYRSIPKADDLYPLVSAASIVSKVERDAYMTDANIDFPEYEFHINKGYGVARHCDALREFGPCAIHRRSFRPVAEQVRLK